jgi:hypothetical protein
MSALPSEPPAGTGLRPSKTRFMERVAVAWCRLMHRDAMWPIHGKYQCRKCLRSYPISWAGEPEKTPAVRRESD